MLPRHLLFPASALCLLVSFPVHAVNEAYDWLMRIKQAARVTNYEGVFVYQNGPRLETMRIFHRASNGIVEERLVSLTGPAREVVRTDKEVRCYLPDQKSVVVEFRPLNRDSLAAMLPDRPSDLDENYVIELGKPMRVADRTAQRLLIKPRDDFRYGYQLWADFETGVLLKAEVLDGKGDVLEQFMFTEIKIGGEIPASALAPQTPSEGMVWYRDVELSTPPEQSWRATRLPKGFQLSSTVIRKLPKRNRLVEQLVYSDGLAAVSVFVEKLEGRPGRTVPQPPSRGALNVIGRPMNAYNVIVVGEVPAKTVSMIGNSLVPAEPEPSEPAGPPGS
jgi:sigma-E factor negative regulatory protein RseB